MDAIVFENVRKEYGRVVAIERVNLKISQGSFVGLIGHNGAGKTTCLKMLMGLLRPTEGAVRIYGKDTAEDPLEARRLLGAVPEEPALYEYLSAVEFLEFVAEVRGGGDVAKSLALTGLGSDADRLIREYSQGMRRKTALAAAMMGDPKVLVLDESINGLDPPSAARVKTALRTYVANGGTVLLSTHVVETIEAVADRVVMLAQGAVVADEQVADLPVGGLEHLFLERLAETMKG
ncbi:MAG: ATP-binding cassette domain-containing protein [Rhodobacterales bacterium]|nr:ATP-binding cassette domain-containing protein [Rhodobacterales bacterium]